MIQFMAAHGKKKKKAKGRANARLTEEAARKLVLENLGKMSQTQLFELGQRAGIYTKTGKLTKRYRDDAEPAV
jgi:hypothetical protein